MSTDGLDQRSLQAYGRVHHSSCNRLSVIVVSYGAEQASIFIILNAHCLEP